MDLAALVSQYGYFAVAAGAFLEGETVLVLAGLAAHRGYLEFPAVVAIAAVAAVAGDQLFFHLGRRHGKVVLARFPAAAARAGQVDALLARWHAPVIVALRFLYGLRIAGPVLLGAGRCPAWKFLVFNVIGALLWAPVVAGAGWVLGEAAGSFLDDVKAAEGWLFGGLVAAGILGVVAHAVVRRWRARAGRDGRRG